MILSLHQTQYLYCVIRLELYIPGFLKRKSGKRQTETNTEGFILESNFAKIWKYFYNLGPGPDMKAIFQNFHHSLKQKFSNAGWCSALWQHF